MAVVNVSLFEKALQCPLCNQLFVKPISITCTKRCTTDSQIHSFCSQCWEKHANNMIYWAKKQDQRWVAIQCPLKSCEAAIIYIDTQTTNHYYPGKEVAHNLFLEKMLNLLCGEITVQGTLEFEEKWMIFEEDLLQKNQSRSIISRIKISILSWIDGLQMSKMRSLVWFSNVAKKTLERASGSYFSTWLDNLCRLSYSIFESEIKKGIQTCIENHTADLLICPESTNDFMNLFPEIFVKCKPTLLYQCFFDESELYETFFEVLVITLKKFQRKTMLATFFKKYHSIIKKVESAKEFQTQLNLLLKKRRLAFEPTDQEIIDKIKSCTIS